MLRMDIKQQSSLMECSSHGSAYRVKKVLGVGEQRMETQHARCGAVEFHLTSVNTLVSSCNEAHNIFNADIKQRCKY